MLDMKRHTLMYKSVFNLVVPAKVYNDNITIFCMELDGT